MRYIDYRIINHVINNAIIRGYKTLIQNKNNLEFKPSVNDIVYLQSIKANKIYSAKKR